MPRCHLQERLATQRIILILNSITPSAHLRSSPSMVQFLEMYTDNDDDGDGDGDDDDV